VLSTIGGLGNPNEIDKVYFYNNFNGVWHLDQTLNWNQGNVFESLNYKIFPFTFNLSTLQDGNYKWRCAAFHDAIFPWNQKYYHSLNKTILITTESSNPPTDTPPTFSGPIGPLMWPKNNNYTILDLGYYFYDDGPLIYTATTPSHFTVKIDGSKIKFIPETNFVGTQFTTITATDEDGNLVTASNILLNVTEANLPPIVTVSPASGSISMEVGESKFFSVSATDPEGASLTYSWTLDGVKVGNGTSYTYPAQTIPKNQTLKINVSDSYNIVSATWNVRVIPDEGLPPENNTPSCDPLCVCASNTCAGRTCIDSECGTICQGTKTCDTNPDECNSDDDCATDEECIAGNCEIKEVPETDTTSYLIWGAVIVLIILIAIGIFFLIKTLKKNKQMSQLPRSSSGPVYPR
jgi:hypothetical protein